MDSKFWYILLNVSFKSACEKIIKRHIRNVNEMCKEIKIIFRSIKDDDWNFERYIFRFHRYKRSDILAYRIGECFYYLLSIIYGDDVITVDNSLVFRINNEIIESKDSLSFTDLLDIEMSRDENDRIGDYPAGDLGHWTPTDLEANELIWRLVIILMKNEYLFDAVRFLSHSFRDFFIRPDSQRAFNPNNEQTRSLSSINQSKLENALQNAYKAIEAIIGDPPKKDKKLIDKLKKSGFNPSECAGFSKQDPLYMAILKINKARDKKAAHAKTGVNRKISINEMLEYSYCARQIVFHAIEKKCGKPIFQYLTPFVYDPFETCYYDHYLDYWK